jgi:large subunit ribosomal protein L31
MKKDIHPEFHKDAQVKCACGAVYNIASVKKNQEIEICSACHPFYTGQEKTLDAAGRVEKFKARMAKAKK